MTLSMPTATFWSRSISGTNTSTPSSASVGRALLSTKTARSAFRSKAKCWAIRGGSAASARSACGKATSSPTPSNMPKGRRAGSTRTPALSTWMPTVGVDRFAADRAARHMISHTMEMMLAAMSVIWGGVVDRHPRLRIAFLESGGGWIAPWLDRMDRHFDDHGFNETAPKMRPSELFQRNCWISFEPVEASIAVLADYIGPNKIMWATDYPHQDGFFPGAPDMVRERLKGTSAATQRGVLAGGALSFYGMN